MQTNKWKQEYGYPLNCIRKTQVPRTTRIHHIYYLQVHDYSKYTNMPKRCYFVEIRFRKFLINV